MTLSILRSGLTALICSGNWLTTSLLLSGCQLGSVQDGFSRQIQTPRSQHHPVFNTLIPQLASVSEIPLLLPSDVPESDSPQLVAVIESSSPTEYQIMLAFDPDCNGGTACRLGSIRGEFMATKNSQLKGKQINISDDLTGYWQPATCGANCSDATLTWMSHGTQYQVSLQGGQLKTLLQVAQSMNP